MDHDRSLFVALVGVLLGFGVLMVYSASITSQPSEFEQVYLSRHLVFLALGLVASWIAANIPSRVWMRLAPYLFVVTLALLVLVLLPGIGTRVNGAQRWLRRGPFTLQPSELAKLTLPLFLCALIERRRALLRTWIVGPVLFLFPIALVLPLVLRQPDLGTGLFLTLGGGLALFIGGWPIRNFLFGIGLAVPVVIHFVVHRPYQMQRITGFLAAWADLNKAPYQLQQSLWAIGAGGLWGVGLGKGWQKLSFLPEANTDFVFAVVGEELGLVGALSLVALWGALYLFGLRLLKPLDHSRFEYITAFTLLTQLVFQAILNVAVVTAMVPPKGISHPLLSYGGSNLVVSLVSLGIILSLAKGTRSPVANATSWEDDGEDSPHTLQDAA